MNSESIDGEDRHMIRLAEIINNDASREYVTWLISGGIETDEHRFSSEKDAKEDFNSRCKEYSGRFVSTHDRHKMRNK